jgi:subtilisin family serine protease
MPMKLIEPVDTQDVAPSVSTNITWGVKAVGADASAFNGSGVTIAVLDTGIDPSHTTFSDVQIIQRNFTTESSDNDTHGHGTHCAGTIFGRDVNGLRIGVAPGVNKAIIGKVLGKGGGTSATLAKAIQWAIVENEANIVSMSLGIDFPGYVSFLVNETGLKIPPATSIALEAYRANVNLFTELANYIQSLGAFGQGAVIIAASGNESNRPEYEISVAPPAAGTGIISVGALGQDSNGLSIAKFSNNQVDVSAPGVGVVSAAVNGGLTSKSGTSMATPHVAGVAALWAQRQLDNSNQINYGTLKAQIVASGSMVELVSSSEPEDVGVGLVKAPLN